MNLPYREAMDLLAAVREHNQADQRFQAELHGRQLQEHDGRVHGMRQSLHERIRARRR